MRKKQILILTVLAFLFFNKNQIQATNLLKAEPIFIHDEILGTFAFEQLSNNLLLLTTKVEKRHFVHALKREGDCSIKNMMRVCGNKYLEENFLVKIDGREMILKQDEIIIGKEYVTLVYTISLLNSKITEIEVSSSYMFKYNDHAILKILFDINGSSRSFHIKNRKRTINAKF